MGALGVGESAVGVTAEVMNEGVKLSGDGGKEVRVSCGDGVDAGKGMEFIMRGRLWEVRAPCWRVVELVTGVGVGIGRAGGTGRTCTAPIDHVAEPRPRGWDS